ncbi:50S ribosomal protein L28 [Candidatus Gottesmanbacteria bacterium]|nr:50S ribosomal protein L28 [Candidatus Gottesmanbacteria bacterium]
MAAKCENCGRGSVMGHQASHAKNRTARLFRANLQKLFVLKHGIRIRVKFCSSCIHRLKKFGEIGDYMRFSFTPALAVAAVVPIATPPSKKHIDREAKKVEEIMKKVEKERVDVEKVVKVEAKKKAEEQIKIEELVGKR